MKLNLGGGKFWKREGWMNLDKMLGHDLSVKYLSDYKDQSVDLIYTSHCIEHLPWDAVPALLCDIFRVLKSKGTARIVVPDMDIVSEILDTNNKQYLIDGNGHYYKNIDRRTEPVIEDAKELIGYKGVHNSFFTFSILNIFLRVAGFKIIKKLDFGNSGVEELSIIAKLNKKGMPTEGFDNSNTRNISLYVEVTKK